MDALTIKAFITSEDAGELIAGLEHAATCGEKRLGEEFFAEFMGDFWPMVEARPYMRTIKQLAEVLWNVGRRLDAIDHYENLLDLDPADHMGNSTLLLGYYLAWARSSAPGTCSRNTTTKSARSSTGPGSCCS